MGRVAAAALGLLAAGLLVAQEVPTFTSDVRLVRLLATVKDDMGRPVGGLNKEDFSVFDNGVRQEIAVFERHTEQPLSIALLVDTSGSTAKELQYEAESVSRFARALFREGNPKDSLALFSFNWEVQQRTEFIRNGSRIDRAMRGLKAEAGTAMYDAVYLASQELEKRDGRKVMVIVTDGGDTVSTKRFNDALLALHGADAILYPLLVLPITNDAGRNIGGENALATLATGTGGRVFQPSLGANMDQAFDEILRDLRTQYLVGYYPRNVRTPKDLFHRVELKTARAGLRVLTRTGYYGVAAD